MRTARPWRALLPLIALLLAPLAAAAQGYVAQPGDVLRVEVLEDPDLSREALVTPDGSITFPFVGTVSVRGRTIDQVRRAIIAGLRPQFTDDPTVFVSVTRLAEREPRAPRPPAEPVTTSVFITGEIANPGAFAVEPGTTILQLIATAGGLTRFAADGRIELRRADHSGRVRRYKFDYDGDSPSISAATPLLEGDVVVVPERRLFEFD